MPEIQDYDGLASSNSAVPPNGFPDATMGRQYPSITREMMARMRRFHDDICGRLRSSGNSGNYVVATSRGVDLSRGFSVRFRANHENPSAGPTLSVGGSGQRPLTYADGSTIPAGALKSGQLLDASIDTENNRWNLSIMPGGTTVTSGGGQAPTVTGDKLSLQGEAQGSVAIRAGTAWIASAAGTATQYLRGGPNPTWATPAGMCLLACTLSDNVVISNRAGLPHTATLSRLARGSYRITVSPGLPAGAVVICTSHSVYRQAGAVLSSATTINVEVARTVDPDLKEDIGASVSVVVF